MSSHYANLTNGILCAPGLAGYTRIPSTFCEQKLWGRVIYGAGPDMLSTLAMGYPVIVHDQSEKQRATRAQWQGLSWLRYACSAAWGLDLPTEYSRNGMNVTDYWRACWEHLADADRNWLIYFKRFAEGIEVVDLKACTCERQPWMHGDGRRIGLD